MVWTREKVIRKIEIRSVIFKGILNCLPLKRTLGGREKRYIFMKLNILSNIHLFNIRIITAVPFLTFGIANKDASDGSWI